MKIRCLWLWLASSAALSAPSFLSQNPSYLWQNMLANISQQIEYYEVNAPLLPIQNMLLQEGPTLQPLLLEKVLFALQCSKQYQLEHNQILTVIDFSLPSSEKRLWIFDLANKKRLFHTYVSHGIASGRNKTQYFSNKYDSKSTSIGIYRTEATYFGRDGYSLRLGGLERGFNDNAMGRYIVMHGGWYVEEDFIKKYGRAGRSWGCPAVPLAFSKKIIDAIKNKSLFVAYYPDEDWLKKSRFLHCSSLSSIRLQQEQPLPIEAQEQRESILFADMNNNHKREESEPVVAIEAQNYQKIFQTIAPLERMLRRQIEKKEYIALNSKELDTLVQTKSSFLQQIFFVTPVIKMQRGYYETTMQPLALGKIASVQMHTAIPDTTYTVHFEKNSAILLRPYHHFIRWVGL